jgi:ketosteroid isomerase-like protein
LAKTTWKNGLVGETGPLADQIREAFVKRDLDTFGTLLADDVRWGDENHPRGCRNRSDVLNTFSTIMSEGVEADIVEVSTGKNGVLFALRVHWPEGAVGPDGSTRLEEVLLYQIYRVANGQITEIQRFDDRASAAEAAGIPAK